jgi:transcriptional regulator with XRE-family HTH domain
MSSEYVIISPTQCKAARELLEWKQEYLSEVSNVGHATISKFERKISNPTFKTLNDLKKTFEEAGIIFLNSNDEVGVKLKISTTANN